MTCFAFKKHPPDGRAGDGRHRKYIMNTITMTRIADNNKICSFSSFYFSNENDTDNDYCNLLSLFTNVCGFLQRKIKKKNKKTGTA